MMPKRQEAFRADYRPRISPWYSGWLHVAVIYAIGGVAPPIISRTSISRACSSG